MEDDTVASLFQVPTQLRKMSWYIESEDARSIRPYLFILELVCDVVVHKRTFTRVVAYSSEWSGVVTMIHGQAPAPEGARRSRTPYGRGRNPASESRKQYQHVKTSGRETEGASLPREPVHLDRPCHPPLAFDPTQSIKIQPADFRACSNLLVGSNEIRVVGVVVAA